MADQQLLIGGEWVDARSAREYEQRFPFTGEVVGTAAAAGPEDANAAADAARAAFASWSRSQPGERRMILLKAADLLSERAERIAGIVTEETGGVFGWGMFNVQLAAGMLREAAAQAYGLVGEVIPSDVPGKLAMGVRQPAGVVVAIAPWNAPVILATRSVATPIAYANTVVLKASEICPRTHAEVARALVDAGLPPGVINLITNDPAQAGAVVDALIEHPAGRARARPADRERHLPRQRHHRAGRASDAVRRRQGQRLGPLRRARSARGVHRAALDHRSGAAARVPDLMCAPR
ncbi:MAG TPA: aldehyde dehydrogenase family protein [Solirubrobacteraceae bacterium]|jgi:benzaldehyde dehydrogenase (NAD)